MGLFSAFMGNASTISREKAIENFGQLFIENEVVELAFKLIRDTFIFTNKRIIIIEIQGVTGQKQDYLSIPYKSISRFSIETAGTFDLEAELKIWISSEQQASVRKAFNRSVNVYEVQRVLAHYVLK